MTNIPTIDLLIRHLQRVPYLASKNIYKVASYFLYRSHADIDQLCSVLKQVKEKMHPCSTCYTWCEQGTACMYCTDIKRDKTILCVVEQWYDLLTIERTGGYNGQYHVLTGLICPLEGIGPEELTIYPLIARVNQENIKEVILTMPQTPEGEATVAYITKKLKSSGVLVTCLARGIPVGSQLEFVDRLTVYKALTERRPI
ncbi:recombination mediator RecR [Vermiphilus pyriformis]|jgi:recombination protein RecR|uniref:Recombination protein RecR n=1 Tax=candidate division TM6 bacterium JCVI TM6SC1 TaxID=1306947 RepID=A0A0D2JE40_9BACT|nr:hypothetical protein J120_03125 [candidate division TM6 bacterium JCVI TM6SC1]UNE35350.1 MAG: recombination mediator RecR [Vermiphilus pyriformis]